MFVFEKSLTNGHRLILPGIAVIRSFALILVVLAGWSQAHAKKNHSEGSIENKLAVEVKIRLANAPVRNVCEQLGAATQIDIFLDRRIDPDLRISIEGVSQPLRRVLEQIAKQLDTEILLVGPIVYLGPQATVACLKELRGHSQESVAALPKSIRMKYLREGDTQWDRLSEPRTLVIEMLAKARLRLKDQELIPHDLWPKGSLCQASLADRLTVLLAGFDLHWEPSAENPRQIRLLPAAEETTAR